MVPTQLYRLLNRLPVMHKGFRMKRILIGGAAVGSDLMTRAYEGNWPVAASYGSTETASQVVSVPPGVSPRESGFSSGKCLPHVELSISNTGELLVKGPSVCIGEWQEGRILPVTDMDGWYHTGDSAVLEDGWVFIEGRMDQMFISGGENVHPERIETELLKVSGREQAVIVPVPDPEFGHRPGAWVTGPVLEADVETWSRDLRRSLPGYMIPIGYRSLTEGSGLKPDREALTKAWT